MNYKLLFPTYRTRERWVLGVLDQAPRGRMLNVGAGEGDIDAAIAARAIELESCDINADDVARARALNAAVPNLRYSVQDSEALAFADASFDVVTCLEVIEHVAHPERLLAELARVLRPNGLLVLTCPSRRFPLTYDPMNAALALADMHLPIGAYAYGHSWLVDAPVLEGWLAAAGFAVERADRLSGWLVGAFECYWPGLLQRLFKANAANSRQQARQRTLRPSVDPPPLLGAVDTLIACDRALTPTGGSSVGLAYTARARKRP